MAPRQATTPTTRRSISSDAADTGNVITMPPNCRAASSRPVRPTLSPSRVAYTAAMPIMAPWASPTSRLVAMPVGTMRASSRIDSRVCSCASGTVACSDIATGTTASEATTAAMA